MITRTTFMAILGWVLMVTGCMSQSMAPDAPPSQQPDILAKVYVSSVENNLECRTLFAGQTIDAGTVCLSVENDSLHILFTTTNNWELTEAHLWVGEALADMPQTRKGNPKIGNFPFNSGDITGSTSMQFSIAISDLGGEPYVCDKTFFVAAHAALQKPDGSGGYQTETGWADGDSFVDKGSWATYFSYTFVCGEDPEEPPVTKVCETAFATGDYATCFQDSPWIDTPRWGWTNGPLSAGTYTFPIYAGAGQCDTTKGEFVGELHIVYDGMVATISYVMEPGFTMDETHLYVGNEPLARNVNNEYTVAPGQYGNIHELSNAVTDVYITSGLSGDLYVVAHAVTCSLE